MFIAGVWRSKLAPPTWLLLPRRQKVIKCGEYIRGRKGMFQQLPNTLLHITLEMGCCILL
jgi:hypothetical protein